MGWLRSRCFLLGVNEAAQGGGEETSLEGRLVYHSSRRPRQEKRPLTPPIPWQTGRLFDVSGERWGCLKSSLRDARSHRSHPAEQPGLTQISWRCSYLVLPGARSAARAKQQPLERLPSALSQGAGGFRALPLPPRALKPGQPPWALGGLGAAALPGGCSEAGCSSASPGQGKVLLSWAEPNNPTRAWAAPADSCGALLGARHDTDPSGIALRKS